jgi:hypothetical protein
LPFFTGTGPLLVRKYTDHVLSTASFEPGWMVLYLGILLLIGVGAGICVPRLPLGVPRRGFDMYTWMAAFDAKELVPETSAAEREREAIPSIRGMEPYEIENAMGDLRFRYNVNRSGDTS